ncbi:MAG: hypothetical protein IKK64_03045 [Bacteroidales bacterium]|nr:hypothetical protein [Bacteroidales bacterium]
MLVSADVTGHVPTISDARVSSDVAGHVPTFFDACFCGRGKPRPYFL